MKDLSTYHIIGTIDENLTKNTQFSNAGTLFAAPGVIRHVQKHLSEFSDKEKEDIISTMKDIFNNPDYVGQHPKKIGQALEVIKKLDNNILLSIEIDKTEGYNYVSSMYVITQSKLDRRIQSNRAIEISNNIIEVDFSSKDVTTKENATVEVVSEIAVDATNSNN